MAGTLVACPKIGAQAQSECRPMVIGSTQRKTKTRPSILSPPHKPPKTSFPHTTPSSFCIHFSYFKGNMN